MPFDAPVINTFLPRLQIHDFLPGYVGERCSVILDRPLQSTLSPVRGVSGNIHMIKIEPGNATLGARVTEHLPSSPMPICGQLRRQAGMAWHRISRSRRRHCGFRRASAACRHAFRREGSREPGIPEVSILSNVVENGRQIGIGRGCFYRYDL
jgi:hypothetical protein